MLYSSDRTALRRAFADAWRKHVAGAPLQPLEASIADVVAAHPEYRRVVEDDSALDRDFVPEAGQANPYLHMAMHLTLREQQATDRPAGIAAALSALAAQHGDAHAAEHAAMDCLGRVLWEAQRAGRMPDEGAYLACVRALAERPR